MTGADERPTIGVATGAGRGMGFECARRLTSMVDVVVAVDRDEAALADACERLHTAGRAEIRPAALDVTDRAQLEALAAQVQEGGRLRAVAHAAGISPTMADWRRVFEVDLVGSALLAEVLRPLAGRGTAMVFFASMAAEMSFAAGVPPEATILDDPLAPDLLDKLHGALGSSIEDSGMAYSWAKLGVQRLVRREAVRLGTVGARICSLSPGLIDTPMGRQEAATHEVMAQLLALTPLGREARAGEVAAVVAFLLSDEASFMSGVDVLVDGGVCAAVSQLAAPA